MKYLKLSLILTFFVSQVSFSQIEVSSSVKEATIFGNKAQLTRVKTVNLKKGDNILKFSGLESSIQNSSFQISGTGGITIISNTIRMENTEMRNQPVEIQRLNDSLKKYSREEQLTRNSVSNLSQEKQMILSNKNVGGQDGFNLDNMLDLAEYYRNSLDKLDALMYDKNLELNKIREKKKNINKKLNELGYKSRSNCLFVTVYSENAQSVSMKLNYIANNIGWTPFYELKSDGVGTAVIATCKAKIYQNSQSDWNNVKLTLSTSNPSNYGSIPTVHPWVLRFRGDARRYKKSRAKSSTYDRAVSNTAYEVAEDAVAYDSKSTANYTTAVNNMINREFNISLPYSIKGNNGKAVIELEKFNFDVEYIYYAAPKYDCSVYLIAHISDWEKYNLLPGNANLFLEGTFVGTTMINPNETSDTMTLVLGKDKGIVAKREKTKDYTRNALLGGKKKVDLGIQISVKNNKGKDVEIIIEDQVPITSNEKIEIDIKDISGAKKEDKTGKLTWKYTLKSGENKVHRIKYEVKYPKNKPLSNF